MSNSVPEGWKNIKFGDIAEIHKGLTYATTNYSDKENGFPFITLKCIKKNGGFSKKGLKYYDGKYKPQHEVVKGDVVFANTDLTRDGDVVGSPLIVPYISRKKPNLISMDLSKVIPKRGTHKEFIYYWLTMPEVKRYMINFSAGSTVLHLNTSSVPNIPILAPPLPEQKKIAAILTSVDTVIEKTQAQIDKLKDLKTGMMQELLTKGIGHTEFKDSPVGRIPVEWDVVSFQDIATCKPKKFNPSKDDFIYNCVELEHLSQETGQIINTTPTNNVVSIKNIFNVGDILFGKLRPYLKKYALPDFSGVCSSEIWVFKPKDGIDNYFLYYNVQSERFIESANKSCGTKMPRAELSTVMDTVIVKPPTEEQIKIGKIIKTIDDSLMTKQDKLSSLRNIKKALMQDLLTGKVRVKV